MNKVPPFVSSFLFLFFLLAKTALGAFPQQFSMLTGEDELGSLFPVASGVELWRSEFEGEDGSKKLPGTNPFDLATFQYNEDVQFSELFQESAYLVFAATIVVGGLYCIPEDISGWKEGDRDVDYGTLTGRYWENVNNGPVIDSDNPYVNYMGHPYVGAVYYVRARHKGYSGPAALAYSFFMSTFIYEYGVEAFFEKPSYQDIIITPIFGAILGELSLNLDHHIKRNNGELFHSPLLGDVAFFLIDPLEYIITPCKQFLRQRFDLRIEKSFFYVSLLDQDPSLTSPGARQGEQVFGVRFVITGN